MKNRTNSNKVISLIVLVALSTITSYAQLNSAFEALTYKNPPINGSDFIASGWVYDGAYVINTPIPVEVYVDGVWNQEVMTNIARQDVTDWFHYNNGNLLGFQFGLKGLDYSKTHKVDIYMMTAAGAIVLAGTKNTTIQTSPVYNPPVPTPYSQKSFMISSFYALDYTSSQYVNVLNLTKAAGFDMVETAFIDSSKIVPALIAANRVGIKILAQDLLNFSGFQNTNIPTYTQASVLKRISAYSNFKNLEGYFIWDEPLTAQNVTMAKDLTTILTTNDPSRLAFSCMLPSYGQYTWAANTYTNYVDHFLTTINPKIISFDYYPFNNNTDVLSNNTMWRDYGYLRQKSLALNKPMWFYIQAKTLATGGVTMTIERIKAQMYAGLTYGAKELSYYSSGAGALLNPFPTYSKTALYEPIKALNAQIKNLGNLLFKKTSQYLYQTSLPTNGTALYYLDNLAASMFFNSTPAPPANLVIGVFSDVTTKKYVVITNISHTSNATGSIALKSPMYVGLYDKSTNCETWVTSPTSSLSVNLLPGEAVVYVVGATDVFANLIGNFEALNHYTPPSNGWDYIVSGWVYDSESPEFAPNTVCLFIDGVFVKDVLADGNRPDLIGFNGITTANHGYQIGINGLNPSVAHTVELKVIKSIGGTMVSLGSKVIPIATINDTKTVLDEANIYFYPNPSKGIVHIDTNREKILKTTVFDIRGKKIFESKSNNSEIDLSSQPKGVYIVNLQLESSSIQQKVVIL